MKVSIREVWTVGDKRKASLVIQYVTLVRLIYYAARHIYTKHQLKTLRFVSFRRQSIRVTLHVFSPTERFTRI